MGLNIKNSAVEKLAEAVAALAQETKTEAIRRALAERLLRLQARAGKPGGRKSLRDYMEQSVWPTLPPGELGRTLTRDQEDQLLGYGPKGD
jgi:antitoxin VapB